MGCRSCGGGKARNHLNLPLLDQNKNTIAKSYQKSNLRLQNFQTRKPKNVKPLQKGSGKIIKKGYPNLITIKFKGQRINIKEHSRNQKAVYIIGYMEGCGSCNYMKRLINKIATPEILQNVSIYILDKAIAEPDGYTFKGNPTIVFMNNGKLKYQNHGIKNNIGKDIRDFADDAL